MPHTIIISALLEYIAGWLEVVVCHGLAAYLNSSATWTSLPPAKVPGFIWRMFLDLEDCPYLRAVSKPDPDSSSA